MHACMHAFEHTATGFEQCRREEAQPRWGAVRPDGKGLDSYLRSQPPSPRTHGYLLFEEALVHAGHGAVLGALEDVHRLGSTGLN
jgi:hypothetical protein